MVVGASSLPVDVTTRLDGALAEITFYSVHVGYFASGCQSREGVGSSYSKIR